MFVPFDIFHYLFVVRRWWKPKGIKSRKEVQNAFSNFIFRVIVLRCILFENLKKKSIANQKHDIEDNNKLDKLQSRERRSCLIERWISLEI